MFFMHARGPARGLTDAAGCRALQSGFHSQAASGHTTQYGDNETKDASVDPFVRERGYAWEIHIDETPIELWSIEGMKPPAPGSDWEKRWAQENRAVPFSHT
jgi:hypothetical protein